MLYPPFGLFSMLMVPAGVGKTMFAFVYGFAKTSGVLDSDAINCAKYSDMTGLVQMAGDEFLFLNEIHR